MQRDASYYAAMNTPHNSTALLSEMIGLVYEAAADLSLWPKLLESMSGYLELSLPATATGLSAGHSVSQSERSLLHFLAPHFERAHALHLQLVEVTEERNMLERIMNRLPLGAAIIDARCNAISMNHTIISLLQGSELLKLTDGRLVSVPSNALEQAVVKVLSGEVSEVVVRLSDEEASLSLWISRGAVPTNSDALPNRLMVFVASRTTHALSEEGLTALFGLTPAEARVTQKFALGCTVEESAEMLGLSRHTVKTHLSRVFSKTGVKRQAELMQTIYASPLWLKSDSKQTSEMPLAVSGVQMSRRESEEQRIQLSDGRWLYFSDSGDPQGQPVILMHGIAGSRYLRHPDDDILLQEGVRLIIPERPGSGDSEVQEGRRVIDWVPDIAALADQLDLKSFAVLGYSAGTPYALAVAAAMPERIDATHIVAPVPPLDSLDDFRAYDPVFRMTLFIAKYTPGLLPAIMRVMVKDIRKNVYHHLERILADAPERDREILANPRLRANIATGMRASVRNGESEIALEVALTASAWGIKLDDIAMPVHIWHGEKDPLVSPCGAKKLAKLLPEANITSIPSAGHYLLYSHWQELLHVIKSPSRGCL